MTPEELISPTGQEIEDDVLEQLEEELFIKAAGGKGSGNFGHKGRPGEVGGSADKGFDSWDETDQRATIDAYCQNSYEEINDHMRGGHCFKAWAAEDGKKGAKYMLDAFQNPKVFKTTDAPMTVYRGIENFGVWQKLSKASKGDVITDKAFLSTTKSEKIAELAAGGFGQLTPSVIFQIEVPKGTRYLTGRRDEKEMILENGTRLKVLKVENVKKDEDFEARTTIRARVLR